MMGNRRHRPRTYAPSWVAAQGEPPPSVYMDLHDEDRLPNYFRPTPAPETPEETVMPVPDARDLAKFPATMADLQAVEEALREIIAETNRRLGELEELVLSMPTGGAQVTDSERIVRFLTSHAGVKFTPGSIGENIGTRSTDSTCRKLAARGEISCDAKPGHHPLYFVKG